MPLRTILLLLAAVSSAQAQEARSYTAPVHWGERIRLSTPLAGTVAQSRCREGTAVAAGEEIFRLDDRAWAAEHTAAQAAVRAARLQEEEAGREMERVQALYDDGLVAEQERRQAEIALAEARARLQEAEARAALAGQRLDQARIQAPRDGRLIACLARPGEAVSGALAPAVLAEMVAGRSREVVVNLLETRPLALGAEVSVQARGRTYAGRVVRVERVREAGGWSNRAWVRFEADEELPIGERVKLTW